MPEPRTEASVSREFVVDALENAAFFGHPDGSTMRRVLRDPENRDALFSLMGLEVVRVHAEFIAVRPERLPQVGGRPD